MIYFLFFIFICSALVQLYYGFYVFKIPNDKSVSTRHFPKVSVIICAKNESENLKNFLPAFLNQSYPTDDFEVIVVNDASSDDTEKVLETFQKQYAHLRILNILKDEKREFPGKKNALDKGIRAANHENILLSDADCYPNSANWIQEMVRSFSGIESPKIVLGYGSYSAKPGILNQFIRWETVHTCMQYSGYAHRGLAYMGVGRNLLYSKSLYLGQVKDADFQKIYKETPSGDDDLLISKMQAQAEVITSLNSNAKTISIPEKSWKSWWKQKTRHVSTGKYYSPKIKYLLSLYALSHSIFWFLSIIFLLFFLIGLLPESIFFSFILIFFIRLSVYWIRAYKWYQKLDEQNLLLFFPIGDLGWAIYNVILSPYIFWKNKKSWT